MVRRLKNIIGDYYGKWGTDKEVISEYKKSVKQKMVITLSVVTVLGFLAFILNKVIMLNIHNLLYTTLYFTILGVMFGVEKIEKYTICKLDNRLLMLCEEKEAKTLIMENNYTIQEEIR